MATKEKASQGRVARARNSGRKVDRDDLQAHAVASKLRMTLSSLGRRLRQVPGSLNGSQLSVIGHLDIRPGQTVTHLAGEIGVRPQSMSATVASLEAANLIQSEPDPSDGRQTLWSLTQAGIDAVAMRRLAHEDWLYRVIKAEYRSQEREEILRAMALLQRIID